MASNNTPLTIEGRFVQGGLSLRQKKDDNGKPVIDKETGKPIEECFMAVAVPKTDPKFNQYWAVFNQVAKAAFPQLFTAADGSCSHPRFAWKLQDGDGVNKNGKSVKDQPGFAGHWVFKMTTRFVPNCYTKDAHGNMHLLQPQDADRLIKRGYQVAVAVSIGGNGVGADAGNAVPGLFVSQNLVLLVAPGEEIISGPDPNEAFAGIVTQAAPAGGLPAPGGLAPPAGPSGGLPPPGGAPAGLPAPGAAPAAAGGLGPPPGAGLGPPPAAAPVYQMQPSAQGATRESLNALGWSDEQLIAAGHMIKIG